MRVFRVVIGAIILGGACVLSAAAEPAAEGVVATPVVVAAVPPANFLADVSLEIVRLYVDKPIDRTKPVVDCILGTKIRGTSCTRAQAGAELVPCEGAAAVDIVVVGRSWTKTTGVNRSVTFCNDGTVDFTVRTRVTVDGSGLRHETPVAAARNQAVLTGLDADVHNLVSPLVRRAALKRYEKNKPEAMAIAEQHAREQLVNDTLTDLVPEIDKGQQSFNKALADVKARGIRLEGLRFRSTAAGLQLLTSVGSGRTTGTVNPAPDYATPGELGVRMHQSVVDGLADQELAGKKVTPEKLDKRLTELLGKRRRTLKKDDKNTSVTFADGQPITVRFDQGRIETVARLKGFTTDDETYPAVNVTVVYRLVPTPAGVVARRESIEAFPPGFIPGKGKRLSGRQIATRRVLTQRLRKELKEEYVLGRFAIPNDTRLGQLEVVSADTRDGWILLAYRRAPNNP